MANIRRNSNTLMASMSGREARRGDTLRTSGNSQHRNNSRDDREDVHVELIQVPMDLSLSYADVEVDHSPTPKPWSRSPAQKLPTMNRNPPSFLKNEVVKPLPQVWHMCELCDNNFSSKKVLLDHLWKVHKTQRLPVQSGIPPPSLLPILEISPFNPRPSLPLIPSPNKVNTHGHGRSLADEIIYHPTASSTRRRTSYSSGSGSSSNSSNARSSINADLESESETGFGETCRVCYEHFEDKRDVLNHMKMFHPTDNKFHCTICDKILSSRAALQGHCRIHTGEKPHNCTICNRAFSNSQTMSRHMRTHTGEKPYQCPVCGKRASLRHNMKLHIKIHEKQMMVEQNYESLAN